MPRWQRAVLAALLAMNPRELRPAPRRRGRGGVREGFAYVSRRRDLQLIMGLVFMLGTFGMNFQITTALMATSVFHADVHTTVAAAVRRAAGGPAELPSEAVDTEVVV